MLLIHMYTKGEAMSDNKTLTEERRYLLAQNSFGSLFKQINNTLEKHANNDMRPLGLTVAQLDIAMLLRSSDGYELPLKQIEHRQHVAQSTAAGLVARMEKKGLVTTMYSPDDARAKIVRLTDRGFEMTSHAFESMGNEEQLICEALTPEEQETLKTLLRKVADKLEQHS